MAVVRLALVIVAGLGGCGRASGDTSAPPPAGWTALPELASAIGTAAKLDGIQAWGQPSKGCYAVSIAADGGGDLATELLGALAADHVATTDLVKPTGSTGILSFAIARGAYRGHVRAQLDTDRIAALACYHNEREPLSCETQCAAFLAAR